MMYQFKTIVTVQDEELDEERDEEQDWELPGKMVVCYHCGGTGKTVNPAIDGHGLTREDFDEDPDFEEDYFAGRYDVLCPVCHGRNVTCEPDYDRILLNGGDNWDGDWSTAVVHAQYQEPWDAYRDKLDDQRFEAEQRAADRHVRRQESGGYDG